jgi:plastocyanin
VSPKLCRLLFVATVVTGFSAPMLGATAASQRSVDAWNPPRNFEVPGAADTRRLDINKDDTVNWNIMEGEHTVTPKNSQQWGGPGSGDEPLTPEAPRYSKTFKTPGDYVYFCSLHGGIDEDSKPFGMWGVIHVIDPTPSTTAPTSPPATSPPATTPPTAPPSTATTRPGATPPATTATAPPVTSRPGPTAPAPTTTTAKGDKNKKPKDETTTTTIPALTPPPPPIDLPDEAIIPTLPGASTPSSADPGVPAEAPADTPEGEAIALLQSKKSGGNAMKLLIVSGIGLGALGIGTAGYKYANRSSKYFPA